MRHNNRINIVMHKFLQFFKLDYRAYVCCFLLVKRCVRMRLDREMKKPISLISRLIKKIPQTLSLKTHFHFSPSFRVSDRGNTKRKLKSKFKKFVANQFNIERKREKNERSAFSYLNIFA